MSDSLRVHALLHAACQQLDESNDHAIAAHVGLAMALMEEKYGIPPADDAAAPNAPNWTPPPADHQDNGGPWV